MRRQRLRSRPNQPRLVWWSNERFCPKVDETATWLVRSLLAMLLVACAVPDTTRAASVVLIGDSIFWGVGAGAGTRTVAFELQGELKNMFVFNYSAPGATMAGLYAPIPRYASYFGGIRRSITLAVIGLGVNDWRANLPVGYFASKYERFLRDLQVRIPRVACVGPLWSNREGKQNKAGKTIDDYRKAIRRVCDKRAKNRRFWDGLTALPADPRFFVDGLHPNRRGHRRYAKWLRDRVRETLDMPAPAVDTAPVPEKK